MLFRLPSEEELTDNKLNEFIAKHNAECAFRFKHLKDAYETDYQIFHQKPKPDYKPDNRIAVNFAKYMVDTFNGYFIGNPIKISVDGDAAGNIKKYVELLDQYNDQDDNNAELSKICCIYGKGYEMYYVDELGNIGITYLTPFDAFMIYDDSVLCRERYFVRLYIDSNDVLHGSVSDDTKVRWFTQKGNYIILDVSIIRFNRIGSEGLSSHSVEGESLSWSENDFAGYMDDIRAYLDDQKESKKGKVRFL